MTMGRYRAPDVYVEEVPGGPRPIEAVGTSVAGLVGVAPNHTAHVNQPVAINNWMQFIREFVPEDGSSTPLSHAVFGFFQNGGGRCYVVNVGEGGSISGEGRKPGGIDVLEQLDEIAIVAAPGYTDPVSYDAVLTHCEKIQDRVAILDSPEEVPDISLLTQIATAKPKQSSRGKRGHAPESESESETEAGASSSTDLTSNGAQGNAERQGLRARQSDDGYGILCFPWLVVRNPLSLTSELARIPTSGHVAGIWARNDATRGVHKAPANEIVRGAVDLTYHLTRDELGTLNQAGVTCIRFFPRQGIRVWGARTLADSSSEWRYINVRRLVNMIKESIAEGTRWVVFEPNDFTLWKSIRRDITAFLTGLWRGGALMGRTAEEAFFVKCDEETNPPDVIDAGMVVTIVGIAPVKPAEFVVFRISQYRGDVEIEG